MKKIVSTSIMSFLIVMSIALVSKTYAQQTITINGPSSVSAGQTTTYSVSQSYPCLNWYVSGGVIQGSSTGSSIQVTWNYGVSSGSVTAIHFPQCTANTAPSAVGNKSISIGTGSGPAATCASLQSTLDSIWYYAPVSDKCSAMKQAYNSLVAQNPSLSSCSVNKHGCQF